MKRTKTTTRIICSALAVIFIMTCFVIPSSAANSSMLMGISSQACKGNLNRYSFPSSTTITQGDTAYLNFAATTDYYFDRAEFYIKAPGQSSYTLVRNYNPVGYFRWCNHAYTFSHSGTYTFRLVIVATNGTRYSGNMTVSVKAVETTQSKPDSNGFYYTDANTSASTYGANNIKVGYTTYADYAAGSYSYLSYVEYYHG